MATVFDVAKYILQTCGPMSTWKLQKLCYYSQAWTLAWDDRPLFDSEFEAWTNGPVCRELFREHQGLFHVDADNIRQGNVDNLTQDDVENINIVLNTYGSKSPYWLREQTHAEDPWRIARQECPDGDPCNNVISRDSMGEYYGKL